MTQLAWRDVAAPDFSTAMQGLRMAGDQIDKAGSGLADLAGSVNTAQNTRAARQFDLNLAKITDPEALKAAQADGSIYNGVNLNHLSPDQINSTVGRVTSLLSNQADLLKNKDSASLLGLNTNLRGIAGTDATNAVAARPHQFALQQIAMDPKYAHDTVGGQAAVSKYLQDNPDAAAILSKLPDSANYDNFTNLQNLARNSKANQGADLSNTSSGLGIQDTVDTRAATDLAGKVRGLGSGIRDWTTLMDNPAAMKAAGLDGYSQQQIERARAILTGPQGQTMTAPYVASDGQSGGGGGGAGGGAAGSGGGAGYDAVYGNGSYGTPGMNPTNMNLGQVLDFGDTLRANTKAKGIGQLNGQTVGTSAMGGYQIEGSTLQRVAPQVFGANWKNVQFTPENQDKLGQAIYNQAPVGSDLHNVWTSLPQGTVKTGNMSWDALKPHILSGESGLSNILQNRESLVGVTTNLGQNAAGSPAQRTARLLSDAAGDDSSAMSVANKLTDKGGDFQGENSKYVSQAIDEIVQESHGRISNAQAGLILQQSAHGQKGFFHRWASKGFGGDGLDTYIDHNRASELIKLAADPNALNAAAIASDTNKTTAGMAAQGNQMLQEALMARNVAARNAALAGRPFNSAPYDLQIRIAQGYASGGMDLAHGAAAYGNPPQNGGATAPPAPRSVPVPAGHSSAVPQGALNAQAYLSHLIAQSIPSSAGPVQVNGIKAELAKQWGVPSLDAVKNPMIAWKIAKMLDAHTAAAQAAASSAANGQNFRR